MFKSMSRKISVARVLEESYLRFAFDQDKLTPNFTLIDLGGEKIIIMPCLSRILSMS